MSHLTLHEDVNDVLREFERKIRDILGGQFTGMYVYGSLALGGFDLQTSDIDFIVVTESRVSSDMFLALNKLHGQFSASGSAWAGKIEAAYIPRDVLSRETPDETTYPQIEKGTALVWMPLEPGWPFQAHTMREHGITVSGAPPQTLLPPVSPAALKRSAIAILREWRKQASGDTEWFNWLRQQSAQAFVVLTLCRTLYLFETGKLASKTAAANWTADALGPDDSGFFSRALENQYLKGSSSHKDVAMTLALLETTFRHATQNA